MPLGTVNSPVVLWGTVQAMILVTIFIHLNTSEAEDKPITPALFAIVNRTCIGSESCNNGVCTKGACHCTKGFGGEKCNRCSAAYHGYPRCTLDETCYAISWNACPSGEVKMWKNEGLLPGRPKRAVAMVPVENSAQNMLGVQIVQGLWGGDDTISLKLCWLLVCGSRQQTGGRNCRWQNGTDIPVYLKNTGCEVVIGRKPSRTARPGAGFKGECDHPSAKNQQICSLPSKRYAVFVKDVSWNMDVDEDSNRYLEPANWPGRYIKSDGQRPIVSVGKPEPRDGFMRLTPLDNPTSPKCDDAG